MKKILLILAIFVIGNLAFAGDFQTFKLDNGQTIVVKEVRDNPIVIIDTWVKTGSIDENDQNNGVAHFLEHMFFKGTKKYPAGEFDRILESKGAETNAATSKDFTHFYITIPSKDFDTALEMHADMILNPLLPRKELEKERRVVLEEISKNEDEPSTQLYNGLNSQLYKEHPYKREVIGKSGIIETITREEMLDFYNKHYVPQNMTTIIIGDIGAQEALAKAKELFNRPQSKYQITKYKKEKPLTQSSEATNKMQVQTGYILIGFKGVDARNRKENYELDVLATILGDGKTSRLYKAVKDEKRLVQSISATNGSSRDDGVFYISANFAPENLEKVKGAILEEISKIQKNPPTKEEMQRAFNIIERDTYYSRESVSNIASEMGYIKTVFGDLNLYDSYIPAIKKVTPQEVQSTAIRFLNKDKMAVSVLLPENLLPISNIQKPIGKQGAPAKIISEDKTLKEYRLSNGATLLINNNTSNDIVAMQIIAKGGEILENKAGIASMVADLMSKGTKKYTKTEFAQILEENGIRLGVSSAQESFNISLKTTKNELDTTLDLLSETVNNAIFDEFEIDKTKSDTLYAIKKSRDNPFNQALEEFKERIYLDSPYSLSTIQKTEKAIPTIKREEILAYYATIFDPQNIIISINGPVNEQKMIDYFTNLFDAKNKPAFAFKTYEDKFPPLATNQKKIIKKDTQTTWMALGWQTCGTINEKDYATLQVINSILGSGMSSRLFVNLRDKQGLAYQVGSLYSPQVNKGFFLTYIGTNPEKALHSRDELLREINVMKKEFVSLNELNDAKEKIIGKYILSQETNMEKASSLGWFEASGRGYEFYKKYPELIQAVTPSDIISVANKYFGAPYVFSIVTTSKYAEQF